MSETKTMKTIKQFVAELGIRMEIFPAKKNPNISPDDWSKDAKHWQCTFWVGSLNAVERSLKTYFSQGSAHKNPPTAEDVLDCLASDACSVWGGFHNGARFVSFENWAQELGYDTDSRKAEQTFKIICEQTGKLVSFMGVEPFEALLHEVERL